MRFKYETIIDVDRDDVIEYLKDEGFFDAEDEEGGFMYDEEAIENYEPTYEDFETVAREKFHNDECEYYGPDPV